MELETYAREAAGVEIGGADGRTVHVLMVPWDTPADVADVIGGKLVAYREQFTRGAFRRAVEHPQYVRLTYGHSNAFPDALGKAQEIREEDDGAHGFFRLNPYDADRARGIIGDMGASVQFRSFTPRAGSERAGELVTRRAVHLVHVAVVSEPAYPDARVLAIREAQMDAEAAAAEAQAAMERDEQFAQQLLRSRELGVPLTPAMEEWLAQRASAS